jgi:hypothetical protein
LLSFLFLLPYISQKLSIFLFLCQLTKNLIIFNTKKLLLSSHNYGFGIRKKLIPDPGVKKVPDPGSGSSTLQKLFDLPNVLAAVVDRLVGGDGNGEELPGELQHRLVLKDDGPAPQARPLQPQPVLAVRIVTRRNLKQGEIIL